MTASTSASTSARIAAAGQSSVRLNFAALLDDRERLLKDRTALPALALLPEHVVMREAMSWPFELVLDGVFTSARFELKQVIGEQMTVSLKRADGSYAPWHGYVKQAAQWGSDGGWASTGSRCAVGLTRSRCAQDGKHPARVNGQPAVQPGDDGRSAGDRPMHAYAQPVVVFDTPSAGRRARC